MLRTSNSHSNRQCTLSSRGRYIGLCSRSSLFPETRREMVSYCIYVESILGRWIQLQNIQQGDAHNNTRTRRVATIPNGDIGRFWDLDRSSKSSILPKTSEVESPTSKMDDKAGGVPFQAPAQAREDPRKAGYTVKTTRSWQGGECLFKSAKYCKGFVAYCMNSTTTCGRV